MIFNSINFTFFFTSFFIIYWIVFKNNLKLQNLLILITSYIFYGLCNWKFLPFLIIVSVVNFYLGISIGKNNKYKRLLLNTGLSLGIGSLVFLKYFNFFIVSFDDTLQLFGINFKLHTLNILVPLGISFFTFKTISYLLDIDKGKIKATTDPVVFFAYVSFFPTLLSGPIDKGLTFIPQLETKRTFNYEQTVNGLRQILWGLFKKVVVADNCATFTNQIYDNYHSMPSSTLVIGAYLYSIQLYADFSGYSDMAIGFSRLIGFNVTKNFDFPFFSQNIAEFWRKWHMSLTGWMTEYLFTPLSIAFRDLGKFGLVLAFLINFTIIGLWHGANWTYVAFGIYHSLLFIPLILKGTMNKKKKTKKGNRLAAFKEYINMIITFTLVTISLILFRSDSIGQAYHYFIRMFSHTILTVPHFEENLFFILVIFISAVCIIAEWFGKKQQFAIEKTFTNSPKIIRWGFYYLMIVIIFVFAGSTQHFIYFQF